MIYLELEDAVAACPKDKEILGFQCADGRHVYILNTPWHGFGPATREVRSQVHIAESNFPYGDDLPNVWVEQPEYLAHLPGGRA